MVIHNDESCILMSPLGGWGRGSPKQQPYNKQRPKEGSYIDCHITGVFPMRLEKSRWDVGPRLPHLNQGSYIGSRITKTFPHALKTYSRECFIYV